MLQATTTHNMRANGSRGGAVRMERDFMRLDYSSVGVKKV